MKTTDLFTRNRSAQRLNESLSKMFGTQLDLDSFDTPKLEDARNKLRTQIHTARQESGFNETIENETLSKAQFMHDAIVAELMDRQEHIVDTSVQEGRSPEVEEFLTKVAQSGDAGFDMLYGAQAGKYGKEIEQAVQEMYDDITIDTGYHGDDDFEQIYDRMLDNIEADYGDRGSDDEGGETDDGYALASAGFGSDEDYESIETEGGRDPEDWDEGNTEPANNFAVSINGKQWKVFKGRGQYAEDDREKQHYRQLKDWAAKKSESTGKKWEVHVTGAPATESIQRTQGESMSNLREGEVQQASAIVTAKTMVDRVSRWIEELSSMENDTLLQLGDSIRDEMGQEQAKGFISSVAPAIQQALENLKSTRETMATGVRQLTGEEQGAEMLGAEPGMGMGGDEMGPVEPDAMNAGGEELGGDEFAAAEPAAAPAATTALYDQDHTGLSSPRRRGSIFDVVWG